MMTQTVNNYAKALFKSNVAEDSIVNAEKLLKSNSFLLRVFTNPVIKNEQKINAAKRIFDKSVWGFVFVLIKNNDFEKVFDIIRCYKEITTEEEHALKAKLYCVTKPDAARKAAINAYLKKKYNTEKVNIRVIVDESLIGGFIIQVGDFRLDKSLRTKLDQLSQNLQGM